MLPLLRSKPLVPHSLALLFLVALVAPAHADLYEWTDEDGRTHYSNAPRPGAKRVGLAPIALEEEGSADDTTTDEARRDRRKRQRAERLIDNDEHDPAAGMIEAPAAPERPGSPKPAEASPEPAPKLPDLGAPRAVAPMATD